MTFGNARNGVPNSGAPIRTRRNARPESGVAFRAPRNAAPDSGLAFRGARNASPTSGATFVAVPNALPVSVGAFRTAPAADSAVGQAVRETGDAASDLVVCSEFLEGGRAVAAGVAGHGVNRTPSSTSISPGERPCGSSLSPYQRWTSLCGPPGSRRHFTPPHSPAATARRPPVLGCARPNGCASAGGAQPSRHRRSLERLRSPARWRAQA
jgi:hypothetical protein